MIPKWAKIRKQPPNPHNNNVTNDVKNKQSEFLFRIEVALQFQRRLDRAQTVAWNEAAATSLVCHSEKDQQEKRQEDEGKLNEAMTTTTTTTSTTTSAPPGGDKGRNDTTTTTAAYSKYCCFENGTTNTSTTFPFELLPVTCLLPPTSCRLDRHALADAVRYNLQQKRRRPQKWNNSTTPTTTTTTSEKKDIAVVWIPRFPSSSSTSTSTSTMPSSSSNNSGSGGGLTVTMHLILDQLLRQEPNKVLQQFIRKVRHKQAKRSTSMQDLILQWASQTMAYDSIALILEDPGGFAQEGIREEFFHAIQEWRSLHGLDVSVVVLQNDIMSLYDMSSYFHVYGMRLLHIRIDPQQWMETFWNQILLQCCGDNNNNNNGNGNLSFSCNGVLPLSSTTLRRIQHEFQQQQQQQQDLSGGVTLSYPSLTLGWVEGLSRTVMDFFRIKGSFVWDMSIHPEFLAWCCTDKEMATSLSSSSSQKNYDKNDKDDDSNNNKWKALVQCRQIQQRYEHWYRLKIKSMMLLVSLVRGPNGNDRSKTTTTDRRISILADIHHALTAITTTATATTNPSDNNNNNSSSKADDDITHNPYENDDTFQILQRYMNRRGNAGDTNTVAPQTKDGTTTTDDAPAILNLVNELIVLLGQQQQLSENKSSSQVKDAASSSSNNEKVKMIETGIVQMIDDLDYSVGMEMDKCMDEWKNTNPLYDHHSNSDQDENGSDCMLIDHHRQQEEDEDPIVLRRDIIDGLSNPARAMYALLKDRLSITRDEWFHLCGADKHQFSVGIWTLSVCGLVQAKWARGGNKLIYEKVSVVWC